MTPPRHGGAAIVVPGLRDLFLGFLALALTAFGGALPWARRFFVERRRWLTAQDFTNLLSLCQFIPGPNIMNMSVVVGARSRGVPGAIIAPLGFIAVPFLAFIVLGELHARAGGIAVLRGALAGVGAAAAGMMVATAIQMVWPVLRRRPLGASPFVLATFAAVGLAGAPLPLALAVLTPLSLAAVWLRR